MRVTRIDFEKRRLLWIKILEHHREKLEKSTVEAQKSKNKGVK